MRRLHVNPLSGSRLDPSVKNTMARKNESVGAVVINDSEFKIAVEWRDLNRLPLPIHAHRCLPQVTSEYLKMMRRDRYTLI